MNDLILQREADGNVPAGVVSIDLRRARAAVQVGMDETDAGEGHEVEPVIQPEVVFPDSRKGNLEEISRRADLHHRPEGKVPVSIVVDIESEGEDGSIDRAGREPEVRAKSPAVLICTDWPGEDTAPNQNGQRESSDEAACPRGRCEEIL